MKNRKGIPMMLIGLLMMIAALLLTMANFRTEKEAGEASAQILEALEQRIRETAAPTVTDAPVLETTLVPAETGVSEETPAALIEEELPAQTPQPETSVVPEMTIVPESLVLPEVPLYVRHPEIPMPEVKIDDVYYVGVIEVPALQLRLPVVSEWSYPNLKVAPCRYSGSAYQNNLVIIGHNYETHFGQLKELHIGDEVIFTDMEEHVFRYAVAEIEVLKPTEASRLVGSDYPLSLLTCTVGGRTRLTLRCDLMDNMR